MSDRPTKQQTDRALDALQVLVLDPATRAYLRDHDPRALAQACKALHDVERQYRIRGGVYDVCWYCFSTDLEPGGRCRYCSRLEHHPERPILPPTPEQIAGAKLVAAKDAGRRYEVIVGNVGTVYAGPSLARARADFSTYVRLSEAGEGRAAGEPVTLMRDGEPYGEQYEPPAACDECGRSIPFNAIGQTQDDQHAPDCSLHPAAAPAAAEKQGWFCGTCGTANGADDTHCVSCGLQDITRGD